MASTELDPLFLKGLKLLHSRSKDSAEQLKQLFEEALLQAKHAASAPKDKSYCSVKIDLKKSTSRDDSSSFKQMHEDVRKREIEKRHQDKISTHSDDIEIIDPKIPKLESSQSMTYYPPSPDNIPKLDQYVSKKVEEDSDSSEENADADDFAMEMGLACVICKQLDVTQGNQLIECQECHSLYHQECHNPPASDYDVNDPRRVWYCAKCTKNMKKMASKTQKTTKSSNVTTTTTSQARLSKPESSQPSLVLPFKRTELKAPVSQGNNQSSTNKPIGLAGLAANFSGRVTTASSSTSSSRTISSKSSSSNQNLKSFSTLSVSSSGNSSSSGKSSSTSSASVKIVSSSHSSSSATTVPPLVITKSGSSSSSSSKSGLGLLSTVSAAAAARSSSSSSSASSSSAAAPSSNSSSSSSSSNNSGTKPASCSLLMSADKRVQIMKKRAAKMQEKRRMSSK